jgi:hypothetical protein
MKDTEKPVGRKDLQGERASGGKAPSVSALIEDAVSTTYRDIIEIVSAKIEIAKLEITTQLSGILSRFIVLIIALAGIIYLGAAFSIFIGEVTGYNWLGYFIVSLIFFLGVAVFGKLRPDWLRSAIERFIIKTYDCR